MAKELKTFRLDVENLNFLQTLKEKNGGKITK